MSSLTNRKFQFVPQVRHKESMAPNFSGGKNPFENVVKAKNLFCRKYRQKKYFTYNFKDIL